MESTNFAIAFLAGLIPTLFWLWFWLREDRERPEPWGLIIIAFLAGMAVVPIALPLQKIALELYQGENLIWAWVTIEEVLKYVAALAVVLWHKAVNEPIDLIIYMIVIALGFSALENALFVFNPLMQGEFQEMLLTSKFRFIGATLLHVLASASIGVCLALAYYQRNAIKVLAGMIGVGIATVLHGFFNLFVMGANGASIITIFLFVWFGIIILFFLFERIKIIEAKHFGAP
ncbi:MAG TPA: PrsW family glutamic-type intramembrane protease [Candidatus Paceibacterota bacterium]|nr:PrsW family glutamic-type intramembrane protease [Candidatus Paceibacterota bacterium]